MAHYKTPYKLGPIVGYRLKHSSNLPLGGIDVDCWEVFIFFWLGEVPCFVNIMSLLDIRG